MRVFNRLFEAFSRGGNEADVKARNEKFEEALGDISLRLQNEFDLNEKPFPGAAAKMALEILKMIVDDVMMSLPADIMMGPTEQYIRLTSEIDRKVFAEVMRRKLRVEMDALVAKRLGGTTIFGSGKREGKA